MPSPIRPLSPAQVKLLRRVNTEAEQKPEAIRTKLEGGEWIAARKLRDLGLLERTYPKCILTPKGKDAIAKLSP